MLTSFFLPAEDYYKLDTAIKDKLDSYLVADGEVKHSTISKQYWSSVLGDVLIPCLITGDGLIPNEGFDFKPGLMYTVLRPKALLSEIFDETQIITRILNCPVSIIDFYAGTTPMALEDRKSNIILTTPKGFVATVKTITYELDELEPIQLDYITELFTLLWQRVFDEQEEVYNEKEFTQGRVPVNTLINQFVTAMTFERHHDNCYLSFTYQSFTIQAPPNTKREDKEEGTGEKSKPMVVNHESELPTEIEISAEIPLAEDDNQELTTEDMQYITIGEDGDQAVNFSLIASKYDQ